MQNIVRRGNTNDKNVMARRIKHVIYADNYRYYSHLFTGINRLQVNSAFENSKY